MQTKKEANYWIKAMHCIHFQKVVLNKWIFISPCNIEMDLAKLSFEKWLTFQVCIMLVLPGAEPFSCSPSTVITGDGKCALHYKCPMQRFPSEIYGDGLYCHPASIHFSRGCRDVSFISPSMSSELLHSLKYASMIHMQMKVISHRAAISLAAWTKTISSLPQNLSKGSDLKKGTDDVASYGKQG
ncbi:Hypothetical predicted protein [Podarcis lilfordi]|uniref:Uncharacterized protein n=1 Tax=Podarcis lilfordi TaxID=74358 RepID=A0AA35KKN9_9SAUR|nr:Hypothetical predicted protein [Podarcis lilfordi]